MLKLKVKRNTIFFLLFTLIFPWHFFSCGVNVAYGQTYTDDANGNLTSDGIRLMSYNYNDRMSSLTINNETTNYFYDHTKTRVAKQNVQTNETTVYPNKFFERKGEEEITRYVFLGNQRLAIIDNEGTHLNFSDHLNSSSVTTDLDGNITNLIDYLPYGEDRVNVQVSGNFNNHYTFTDQEKDNESGLMNFDARYYNTAIGRFNQTDELNSYVPYNYLSDPQKLNEYAYARNNPINYVDPNGKNPLLVAAFLGAVWIVENIPAIIISASALVGGSYAASQLGAATGYIIEGDNASAQQCTDNAMLTEAGVAGVAGETILVTSITDRKSKQTNTATGKTDPQTSGTENSASKPKEVAPGASANTTQSSVSTGQIINGNDYKSILNERYGELGEDIRSQLIPKYDVNLAGTKQEIKLQSGDQLVLDYRKSLGATDKALERFVIYEDINNKTQSVYQEVIDQNSNLIHIDKKY